MNSQNWGYKDFKFDVKNTFETIIVAHSFEMAKTDHYSFVEFRNKEMGIYISYDDSKELHFSFKKYEDKFEYEQFDMEQCCLLKGVACIKPVCEFKDQACIKNGLEYIKEIVDEHFSEELKGHFSYEEDYRLLKEENYFLKEKLLFLPIEDKLKQEIKNNYLPNAGLNKMRQRVIKENEYPKRFKRIYDTYIKKSEI